MLFRLNQKLDRLHSTLKLITDKAGCFGQDGFRLRIKKVPLRGNGPGRGISRIQVIVARDS